jgi:hypothetical protein
LLLDVLALCGECGVVTTQPEGLHERARAHVRVVRGTRSHLSEGGCRRGAHSGQGVDGRAFLGELRFLAAFAVLLAVVGVVAKGYLHRLLWMLRVLCVL